MLKQKTDSKVHIAYIKIYAKVKMNSMKIDEIPITQTLNI